MRIAFLTLGCKVNFYETEKMKKKFEEAGHRIVSFEEKADVYVVNTCTVTNIADRKSRKMLHRAKRKNPDAIVVATGCYVDSSGQKQEHGEGIDLFIGNDKKEEILVWITGAWEERMRKDTALSGVSGDETSYSLEAWKERHTRAYVNIQNGCNQYCTYCIIPYVRGPLRSRPAAEVIEEVKTLAAGGVLEVVLTGIHLSSYGVDLSGCKNFLELAGKPLLELIRGISAIEGIQRIRLSSLEPRIISASFVRELSQIPEFCPHFHLSLQSGSNSVLRRMNRHYTAEEYLEKVELIRSYFAQPAITTDIIVGFPGETPEEFEETRSFMNRVGFSKVHVFKYSRRKGTVADAMEHQVAEQEKGKRSDILLLDEMELEKKYRKLFEYSEEKVLFEEIVLIDEEKYLVGYNERYLRIGVKVTDRESAEAMVNTIQLVRLSGQMYRDGEIVMVGKSGN